MKALDRYLQDKRIARARPFVRQDDVVIDVGCADGVMFERRMFHALFATADQKEGMDAFVNKRKAQFKHC